MIEIGKLVLQKVVYFERGYEYRFYLLNGMESRCVLVEGLHDEVEFGIIPNRPLLVRYHIYLRSIGVFDITLISK